MTNMVHDIQPAHAAGFGPARRGDAAPDAFAPIPRITVHAYCVTAPGKTMVERFAADRRMARAEIAVCAGDIRSAVQRYGREPTPDLLVVEATGADAAILAQLDALAEVCDAATTVIVLGQSNEIALYREVLKRGVSDYLRTTDDSLSLVASIASVYSAAASVKSGRVYAFVGAKGGAGSSTVAHNAAWVLAQRPGAEVILADLDLPFGTAGLNFDLETGPGAAEAVRDAAKLDAQMLERLLTRVDDRLSVLASQALLDAPGDLDAEAFDAVLDVARASASHVVLDVPHVWTRWAQRTLVAADEIVVTAAPDLANLRNAWHLFRALRKARPNDPAPRLVINQKGAPKRPEITVRAFAETLKVEPTVVIPCEMRLFEKAANSGRVVAAGRGRTPALFGRLAEDLAARPQAARRGLPFRLWPAKAPRVEGASLLRRAKA